MLRSILLFFLVLSPLISDAQLKRAFNLIEKYRYDQAEELLYKSMGKDQSSPGEKYALSILYFTKDYYNYNIDSAHHYAVSAIHDFENSDEKVLEELQKDEITEELLINQKNSIEEYIFQQAKIIDTEEVYIKYIEKYSTSIQLDSAIWYRNKVAYLDASKVNTWQSYKSFMDRYPESDQYPDAKRNFEKLIYEFKTEDGKLASLEGFLVEYPETPYRRETENRIFEILTGSHTIENYMAFIDRYSDKKLARLSADRIYYISRSTGKTDEYKSVIYKFLDPDSLRKLEAAESEVWFTVRENSNFHLMDPHGVIRIMYNSDKIPAEYLCGDISAPFIITYEKDSSRIINRLGALIYSSTPIDEVSDLGFGFISLKQNSKYGIISKNGSRILPVVADEVKLIHGQYAAYRVGDQWGLVSINGIKLFDLQFSNIEEYSSLVRIYKNDNAFALVKTDDLSPLLDSSNIDLDFHYDDSEILSNGLILTYSGEKQGILNSRLENIVPEESQELIQLENGLLIENKDGFRFVTDQIDISPSLIWKNADFNPNWTALKGPNGWILVSNKQQKIVAEYIDSLRLLNKDIAFADKNGDEFLYFLSGKHVRLDNKLKLEIISSPPTENFDPEYYTLFQNKETKWLLNSSGDTLITGNFKDIKAFGKEYLVVTERKGSGLFDFSGKRLLDSEYDGIANYSLGSITLLKDGKLGFYRLMDSTYIPPMYTKSIQPYNQVLFIASLKEGMGLISGSNKKITDFEFEEINYFNDSIAWVKTDGVWNLYKFYEDTFLEKNITRYITAGNFEKGFIYFDTPDGKGVLNQKAGIIINATFNEIINVGSGDHPVFMAEKFIDEAAYHVVVYYGESGKIIYRQAYPSEEYDLLTCEK